MHLFGQNDNSRKLEAQLKQKCVQMDNLDSTLSVTRKELAEQRREKEIAEQELASQSAKLVDLEDQNDKLSKLLKQKNEYAFSLCSQLESKNKELHQYDEQLQHEKGQVYKLAKDLEESLSRNKALSAEIARGEGAFTQLSQKLKDVQNERGKQVEGLTEELLTIQNSLDRQRLQLEDARSKANSGTIGNDNRDMTMESLRAKISEMEGMLSHERATLQNKEEQLTDIQQKCHAYHSEMTGHKNEVKRLQAAKTSAESRIRELEQQQQNSKDCKIEGPTISQSTGERDKLLIEKDQLIQQQASLEQKLAVSRQDAENLKKLVEKAAEDGDSLQAKIKDGDTENSALKTRISNLQLALDNAKAASEQELQRSENAQAELAKNLERAHEEAQRLKSDKQSLEEQRQDLQDKLKRSTEAIRKVSKEQEKLESKLLKMCSDREAAVADSKAASAQVKRLERDIVDMTRCNAKIKHDVESFRSQVSTLEAELAEERGRSAAAHLPLTPTPRSEHIPGARGTDKHRQALREKCTRLEKALEESKTTTENLRQQISEEQTRHEQTKQFLLREQEYFSARVSELATLTKGEAAGTPGGEVHEHVKRIKARISVSASGSLEKESSRSCTPLRQLNGLKSGCDTPRRRASMTPCADPSSLGLRTPRSGRAPPDSGKYWHKKYEEQSMKAAELETMNRQMQKQLVKTGGSPTTVASLATVSRSVRSSPASHIAKTPRTGAALMTPENISVIRELNFGEADEIATPDMFKGQENACTPEDQVAPAH